MMTMKSPLVSIIVPVYNAEKYLCRCLDSIISQTYHNLDIILVDDGSQDSSGKICDEYAKKDNRIRVIHKKNKGVASARQSGLDISTGEFIIHVDPDDWIEPDMIEQLLNKALEDNVDIIMCNIFWETETGYSLFIQKPTSLNREDLLKDLLNDDIWGSCCNKLIKKECFRKYNISFIEEMNLWEDLYVITSLIYKGASTSYLSLPLYHYDNFSNNNSIVRKPNIKHIFSQKYYIETFESLLPYENYKEAFYKRKFQIKRRCFLTGKKNKDLFIEMFPEFNQRFINEHPFKWNLLKKYRGDLYKMELMCMAITLKDHSDFGYILYRFWEKCASKSIRSILYYYLKKVTKLF